MNSADEILQDVRRRYHARREISEFKGAGDEPGATRAVYTILDTISDYFHEHPRLLHLFLADADPEAKLLALVRQVTLDLDTEHVGHAAGTVGGHRLRSFRVGAAGRASG